MTRESRSYCNSSKIKKSITTAGTYRCWLKHANSKCTGVVGKHLNPWTKCHKRSIDNVVLRRETKTDICREWNTKVSIILEIPSKRVH